MSKEDVDLNEIGSSSSSSLEPPPSKSDCVEVDDINDDGDNGNEGEIPSKQSINNNSQNDNSNGGDWERLKQKKSAQVVLCLLCLVVVVAGAVGSWFGLSINSSDEPITNLTDVLVISEAPTLSPLQFDLPSAENCAAIRKGEEVHGQDKMPIQSYELNLDATPFVPMVLNFSAEIMEEKLREILALVLTGYNQAVRKNLNAETSYAIGNVAVNANGVEGVQCTGFPSPRPSH